MMELSRARFLSLVGILCAATSVASQLPSKNPASEAPGSRVGSKSGSEDEQAIIETHDLANRVFQFRDAEIKVKTIIMLGDLVWGQGNDDYGRDLFQRASEFLNSTPIRSSSERSPNDAEDALGSWTIMTAGNIEQLLIRTAGKYDRSLSERFRQEFDSRLANRGDSAASNNGASAKELVDDGNLKGASRQIESVIRQAPSGRDLLRLVSSLFALRTKDPKAADQLFLTAVAQMSRRPYTSADDVLVLGNYLFAARALDPKLLSRPNVFISPVQVGGVWIQADVSVARPGISALIARAYLSSAVDMLGPPTDDAGEQSRRGAAAGLLLSQAAIFAPELVPQLSAIRSRVASLATNEGGLNSSGNRKSSTDVDSMLQTVGHLRGYERDQYIVATIRGLCDRGDLGAARRIADRIEDEGARVRFLDFIQFRELAKQLSVGSPKTVERDLDRLGSSLQRSLLRLGLASYYTRQQRNALAGTLIQGALTDNRQNGYITVQPYVILTAIEILASIDPEGAERVLPEAITAFNSLGNSQKRAQLGFVEVLTLGNVSSPFRLDVPGVRYGSLSSTLARLPPGGAFAKVAMLQLKDESLLSESILAFVRKLITTMRNRALTR